MPITRRSFLKRIGAALAVAAVSPKIAYDFIKSKANPLFTGAIGEYSSVTIHKHNTGLTKEMVDRVAEDAQRVRVRPVKMNGRKYYIMVNR